MVAIYKNQKFQLDLSNMQNVAVDEEGIVTFTCDIDQSPNDSDAAYMALESWMNLTTLPATDSQKVWEYVIHLAVVNKLSAEFKERLMAISN